MNIIAITLTIVVMAALIVTAVKFAYSDYLLSAILTLVLAAIAWHVEANTQSES